MILDILNKMPAFNQDMLAPPHNVDPRNSKIIENILSEIRRMEIRRQRSNGWESLMRVF
jgi:hypothetical protein